MGMSNIQQQAIGPDATYQRGINDGPMRTCRLVVSLALVLLLNSCSGKAHELFPAGSPRERFISFRYAIYMMPVCKSDPVVLLRALINKRYPDLKIVDTLSNEPQQRMVRVQWEKDVGHNFAPPDLKLLEHSGFGLSPQQSEDLQRSQQAIILDFAHPSGDAWIALRSATGLLLDFARENGGLIWDEETRQVFSIDSWQSKRLQPLTDSIPNVTSEIVIHSYQDGEFVRSITLGMKKLALPDVVINGMPWSSDGQAGHIINMFSQLMAEGAVFKKAGRYKLDRKAIKNADVRDFVTDYGPNATSIACLTLKQGKLEEGDAENRLIEITADTYPGNDVHAKQEKMIATFFGSQDSIKHVKHNKELLDVSAEAKARLPELQKAFAAGLAPQEFIDVKAPFATPTGDTEWMWVEVTSWKGNKIKGLLENDPAEVPNLHAGQVVEVRQEDVFDYIRYYPDKRREGNTTGEILKKMEEQGALEDTTVKPEPVRCDVE